MAQRRKTNNDRPFGAHRHFDGIMSLRGENHGCVGDPMLHTIEHHLYMHTQSNAMEDI